MHARAAAARQDLTLERLAQNAANSSGEREYNSSPAPMSESELGSPVHQLGHIFKSPNARSKSISIAEGQLTHGTLNRHPATPTIPAATNLPSFRVGLETDKNSRCRRAMEDSHAFVYDYGAVKGQGFFAVFDGHAGKHAAEWCGQNFHAKFLQMLRESPEAPIPDVMNKTFHNVDQQLSQLAEKENTHSGCTAVTSFLRIEKEDGSGFPFGTAAVSHFNGHNDLSDSEEEKFSIKQKVKSVVQKVIGHSNEEQTTEIPSASNENFASNQSDTSLRAEASAAGFVVPSVPFKRMLYTANVGDARAVLCRDNTAVRLTYDHKGSDAREVKRITNAGGFILNHRVNGVLAVTRSLGDSSMKEFVVGSPYTTATEITEHDRFLIIACDGLWDVTKDQEAVDLIKDITDAQKAASVLLEHALAQFSNDNLSIMVIKFEHSSAKK